LDELTKQPYSWQHPLSTISRSGAEGICKEWFGPASAAGTCNGFLRNIDFQNKTTTCEPIPNCTYPDNLVFDSSTNQYVCNMNLIYSSYVENKGYTDDTMGETVTYFTNTVWGNILPTVTYTNSLISAFPNMGAYQDLRQNSFGECARRDLMKCPEGMVMWGYEALMESAGDHCRVRCVQLKPY
jgi:hypothetical protein